MILFIFLVNRKSMGNHMNNIKINLMFLIPILASMILSSKIGVSEELQVEMLEMSYSPEILYSEVGDKIIWPKSKGHNVEFIAGPTGFSPPKRSKMNKQFDVVLDIPGVYYYWCTPHKGTGMIGLIVVGKDISNKDEISNAKAVGKSKKKLAGLIEKLND
mgnify:FL=1